METDAIRRRFTVEEFHRMAEAGLFQADERVELIEGEILRMTPIGVPHAACVAGLHELLQERLRKRAHVRCQCPIVLGDRSEPQPDLAIVRRREDGYHSGHPRSQDVIFLVEVADSSLLFDQRTKIPLYAKAEIPEAWLVNLVADAIEVYRRPSSEGYQEVETLRRSERLAPAPFSDCRLTVDEILGGS